MTHATTEFSTHHHKAHKGKARIVRLSTHRRKEGDPLPSTKTRRWVIRRKAQVVNAVNNGLISFQDACERYALSAEEFQSWIDRHGQHGVFGLRITHAQEYKMEPDYS